MTAGNNGTPDTDNDDPFAYLYRSEGGEGDASGEAAARTAAQPGVPRTSYHQVQRVGERRQTPPQQQSGGYGYQQQPGNGQQFTQQQTAYGEQVPQQQPETQQMKGTGHRTAGRGGGSGDRGTGRGPNSKGLLIGAIAVVVAVAIAIVVAMGYGPSGAKTGALSSSSPAASSSPQQSASPSASPSSSGLGATDAASLPLAGGAQISTQYAGAKAAGGKYVGNMTQVGASVTWTVNVPKAGTYDLYVRYANAQKAAASATTVVNGTALSWKIDLQDYGKVGDWTAWYFSYVSVNLNQGSNTVAITCGTGDACHFNLDQLALVNKGGTSPW
jgi:hypothetical protein